MSDETMLTMVLQGLRDDVKRIGSDVTVQIEKLERSIDAKIALARAEIEIHRKEIEDLKIAKWKIYGAASGIATLVTFLLKIFWHD